jgi:hypothetical protein
MQLKSKINNWETNELVCTLPFSKKIHSDLISWYNFGGNRSQKNWREFSLSCGNWSFKNSKFENLELFKIIKNSKFPKTEQITIAPPPPTLGTHNHDVSPHVRISTHGYL